MSTHVHVGVNHAGVVPHAVHAHAIMHVVIVLTALVTEFEERLVREVAALAHVGQVTVCVVEPRTGLIARAALWRARVERAVARAKLHRVTPSALAACANATTPVAIHAVSRRHAHADIASLAPTAVLNLSGSAIAAATPDTYELWWDAVQPQGLGIAHAWSVPPHEITVTRLDPVSHIRRVVERSVLTRTPGNEAADRQNAASRSLALIVRVLSRAFAENASNVSDARAEVPETDTGMADAAAPSAGFGPDVRAALGGVLRAAVAAATSVLSAIGRRASRPFWRVDAWELRYRTNTTAFVANQASITADGFRAYRAPFDTFYADPIAFAHNGIDAVFMEEYPYALGRGVISCAVLGDDGALGAPREIMRQSYHLSYPFVFSAGERVYMIPESSGSRTVELYECDGFPYAWHHKRTLLTHISITDATLHFDGSLWWMFATVGEQGSYAWDELHLFMADAPDGDWMAHPRNPVKCDAASARPAGPLFRRGDQLMRPAQDCSESYGGAVNLCRVDVLSPTDFRETVVGRVPPSLFDGMNGLHTLTATNRLEVVDVRPRRRFRVGG
jgi:hypothetical protein